MKSWIGVDFDGTLCAFDHSVNGFRQPGDPIEPMMQRVRQWLECGEVVKIFTARVTDGPWKEESIQIVQDWLEKHGLPRLEVTNVKDYGMMELWDDRAIQVETNTGRRIGDTDTPEHRIYDDE